MVALRNHGFLIVLGFGVAVSGCTSETGAPSTSPATTSTIVASTSTTLPSSRVSGPDADGTYATVLAAAESYERCWEEREPDEYLLAIQSLGFALTPPELSHVIDGVAQPDPGDVPATKASTRPRSGQNDPGEHLSTVKDAFVLISALVEREPHSVTVAFDGQLCHPDEVFVDPDLDAIDDEVTFEYTVIPTGNQEVGLASVVSAMVADKRYRVALDDGTTFIGDPFVWEACRDQMLSPCGALIVRSDGGEIVYSMAAAPDESTGWWRLPTFGAIELEDDHVALWEGARIELHPDFAPIPGPEGTACRSFLAGETVRAELFIDPLTRRAMAYSCW